jgi:hypothetical protein
MPSPAAGAVLAAASRLRFPLLFKLTLALFVLDLLVPDLIPLADELLLGLAALLLGNLRTRAAEPVAKPAT